jgi:hypothetical protein
MSYDAWLEAPYQHRYEASERFERAAEHYGLDPETDADEIERRMEDDEESAAEEAAERRAELRMEEW